MTLSRFYMAPLDIPPCTTFACPHYGTLYPPKGVCGNRIQGSIWEIVCVIKTLFPNYTPRFSISIAISDFRISQNALSHEGKCLNLTMVQCIILFHIENWASSFSCKHLTFWSPEKPLMYGWVAWLAGRLGGWTVTKKILRFYSYLTALTTKLVLILNKVSKFVFGFDSKARIINVKFRKFKNKNK